MPPEGACEQKKRKPVIVPTIVMCNSTLDVSPACDSRFMRICDDVDQRDTVKTDHFLEVDIAIIVSPYVVC